MIQYVTFEVFVLPEQNEWTERRDEHEKKIPTKREYR